MLTCCGNSQLVYLKAHVYVPAYGYRKEEREGLEVAMKIKGSQGKRRVEWVRAEHPFTAISLATEVHANHVQAHNSALRRRGCAYCRRQNHYAKRVEGLQRALTVQRLVQALGASSLGISQRNHTRDRNGIL